MQSQWQQIDPGLQPGDVLAQRYVITRELTAGGMGRIFLASQKPFNRPMVIKVMHAELADDATLNRRFNREAQAIAQLNHPNTVTVYDFGKTPKGLLFIAMEYVEGLSMGRVLRETGALPLEDAVAFTIQIAQSLSEAHSKGIVHRDLKPDNIMVVRTAGSDSFVKVLDFGIAKFKESDNNETQAGSIVGTPLYMAPEQAQSSPVDGRTDLYSLGCCFYEMLTGAPPFDGNSAVTILLAHQNKAIPDLADDFPPALNRFMKRALAKRAADRPATAADFVAALLSVFQEPLPSGRYRPVDTPLVDRLRYLGSRTPAPESREASAAHRETMDDNQGGSLESRSTPDPQEPLRKSSRPSRSSSPSLSSPGPRAIPSNPLQNAPPSFFQSQVEAVPSDQLSVEEAFEALEVQEALPSRRTPWMYATALVTLLAIGLVVLLFITNTDQPEPVSELFAAPTTEPATPGPVPFTFQSDPAGATVELDGFPIGQTPLEYNVPRSPIAEVRFLHPDRRTATFTDVNVTDGDNRLFATLAPRTVSVQIRTEVTGADLKINGLPMGRLSEERESFIVDWPERELLVELDHPEEGAAFRRFPRSSLADELDVRFPRSAFSRPAN